jgi:hypothetical protein
MIRKGAAGSGILPLGEAFYLWERPPGKKA